MGRNGWDMEEKLGGWDEVDAGEMMIVGKEIGTRIEKRIETGRGNY